MNSEAYKKGYELAFGNPKVEKGRWLFDKAQGKFVKPEDFKAPESTGPTVLKQIDEFVSPIDGTVISDRGQLRKHNNKHGVANLNDYGENNGSSYFERKQAERDHVLQSNTRQAKEQRIETIKRAIEEHRH